MEWIIYRAVVYFLTSVCTFGSAFNCIHSVLFCATRKVGLKFIELFSMGDLKLLWQTHRTQSQTAYVGKRKTNRPTNAIEQCGRL